MKLTHIDENGKATMVDVSNKKKIKRTATAKGKILLNPQNINIMETMGTQHEGRWHRSGR